MRQILSILFLLCIFQIHALEFEEINAIPDPLDQSFNALDVLSAEPSSIVHQCVNVITGDYLDMAVDLKLPGAEPVALSRFYCSSDTFCQEPLRAWKLNHDKAVYQPVRRDKSDLILWDSFGALLPYQRKEKNEYRVHSKAFNKRVTNADRSGKTHLKNKTLQLVSHPESLIVHDGEGDVYHFRKPSSKRHSPLQYVEKASGNLLFYDYDDTKFLKSITAKNKFGQLFGKLELSMQPSNKGHGIIQLNATTTGGHTASFDISPAPGANTKRWILTRAKSDESPEENYRYDAQFARIIKKELPDERFLQIDYYQVGHNAVWPNKDYLVKGIRAGRVMRLSAPVGDNATPIPIYRFLYKLDAHKEKGGTLEIRSGRTEVYDAYDHKTAYCFTGDERLSRIDSFTGTQAHQLYSQQHFFWGEPHTSDAGNLKCKALTLADGRALYCRTYEYDAQGNIITECLYGNLSGTCPDALQLNASTPKGGGCLTLTREYTEENLLKFENHPTLPHDCQYTYYPGTNLLKAKYVLTQNVIRQREFYEYDEHGAVKLEIRDDGCASDPDNLQGVSERHIRRIANCRQFPMGLPENVEEKYLDIKTSQEYLLKRWVNHYNARGKLARQTIYDSQNAKAYELSWEYDDQGNIIAETNALGQTITCEFDANGNKTFEQGYNPEVYTLFHYDRMNRLTSEEEVWSNGQRLIRQYAYDYLGNRISSTDIYGHKTLYAYNDFSELTQVTHPDQQVTSKEYDALGNVIAITDAKGAKTTASYNLHGNPYQVCHADGSQEFYEYTYRGLLKKKTFSNSTYTVYTPDYLGRHIEEKTYAADGTLLKNIKRKYNAFHLLQEIDPAGHVTKYTYNSAGQLMRKANGTQVTEYQYDTLAHLKEQKEYSSKDDYIATHYKYDKLDRITQENIQNSAGLTCRETTYAYDAAGHRSETTSYPQAGAATITTHYNPHGDPAAIIDALGHTTSMRYHYPHAPFSETTDPLGRTTFIEKDPLNRPITYEIKNAAGESLKKYTYTYDAAGNRSSCLERDILTTWEYDDLGRVTVQNEAVGTPEQKTTRYAYTPSGELHTKTKPDGLQLTYEYDPLNRLSQLTSSDGTIHYTYEYDQNDNLIRIRNLIDGTCTLRDFDAQDRLIKETLANGLSLAYSYDNLNRVTSIHLPDQSSIRYTYIGPDLSQVQRLSPTGAALYTHSYTQYDKAGNLLKATLIGQAGHISYTYDLLSRPTSIIAPSFNEKMQTYDPAGNLTLRTCRDAAGFALHTYQYDDLDQLVNVSGTPPETFTYDSLRNPIRRNNLPCHVNRLNQLLAHGTCNYEYDGNGNRIKDPNLTYQYDALDRLTSITSPTHQIRYTYDALHRRLSRTTLTKNNGT
jgi:YD repeat-containing protein